MSTLKSRESREKEPEPETEDINVSNEMEFVEPCPFEESSQDDMVLTTQSIQKLDVSVKYTSKTSSKLSTIREKSNEKTKLSEEPTPDPPKLTFKDTPGEQLNIAQFILLPSKKRKASVDKVDVVAAVDQVTCIPNDEIPETQDQLIKSHPQEKEEVDSFQSCHSDESIHVEREDQTLLIDRPVHKRQKRQAAKKIKKVEQVETKKQKKQKDKQLKEDTYDINSDTSESVTSISSASTKTSKKSSSKKIVDKQNKKSKIPSKLTAMKRTRQKKLLNPHLQNLYLRHSWDDPYAIAIIIKAYVECGKNWTEIRERYWEYLPEDMNELQIKDKLRNIVKNLSGFRSCQFVTVNIETSEVKFDLKWKKGRKVQPSAIKEALEDLLPDDTDED